MPLSPSAVGIDFEDDFENITLRSSTSPVIATIPLIDDDLFELTEMLLASLTFVIQPAANVTINPSETKIEIFDEDSTLISFLSFGASVLNFLYQQP